MKATFIALGVGGFGSIIALPLGRAQGADLISGYYATVDEGSYYDARISVQRDSAGQVQSLTEHFFVEGVATKPFSFACHHTLCVNDEKPYWTITIISEREYEDRYNWMHFRYGLVSPQ